MQVFISWSGERSKLLAESLRAWLPKVIQTLNPWMSSQDIGAGARWLSEVSAILNKTNIGIICITPENQHNPWLLFEAGALSKTIEQTCVCPLVFEMTPGQIDGPLTQFQANSLDRTGIGMVLSTINAQLGERRIEPQQLEEIVDVWWPKLKEKLLAIPSAPTVKVVRSATDQLEEILTLSREQLRRENIRLEASKERDVKLDSMIDFLEKAGSAVGMLQGQAGKMQVSMPKATESVVFSQNELDIPTRTQGTEITEALNSVANPLDATAFQQVTELIRGMQEMDKLRTKNMLTPPKSKESGNSPEV